MDLSVLNTICWTICIICIVAGSALSLTMIWATFPPESQFMWQAWTSVAVLFFASSATLIVSKVLGSRKGGTV